jgi:Ni/Co efflux regulator RcnB
MTKLLLSTAVAGLFVLSTAAFAQPDDNHRATGHEQPARPAQAARPAPAARPVAAPAAARPAAAAGPDQRQGEDRRSSAGRQAAPAAQPAAVAPAQRPGPAPGNAMRGPGPGNTMRGPGPGNAMRGPAPGNAMRGPAAGPRPNYSSYHRNFSAPQRYHAPAAYRRPNGWYAHRWTYGEILPSLFWSQDYWLSDYDDFGLMPPPPGTVWVRDGGDALLIDQNSGEIIQVEYSVFY